MHLTMQSFNYNSDYKLFNCSVGLSCPHILFSYAHAISLLESMEPSLIACVAFVRCALLAGTSALRRLIVVESPCFSLASMFSTASCELFDVVVLISGASVGICE